MRGVAVAGQGHDGSRLRHFAKAGVAEDFACTLCFLQPTDAAPTLRLQAVMQEKMMASRATDCAGAAVGSLGSAAPP